MSFEGQCKLVYQIALNKFNDLVKIEDKNDDSESITLSRKMVRKEMLPEWFQEQQEKEKTTDTEVDLCREETEEEEIARMKAILAHYA